MRIFLLMGVLFGFLFADVDRNVSDEVFLRLDTGGHMAKINDIIVTKSGNIITASDDKTIRIWNSKTGKEKQKILGKIEIEDKGKIYSIALSPDEKYFIVGGYIGEINKGKGFGKIRIYNYKTKKIVKILRVYNGVIHKLSFSNDGKYLIAGSENGTPYIWRIRDFKLINTTALHDSDINDVKIIKELDKYFSITVGMDNKVIKYDIEKKIKVKEYDAKYKLHSIAISNNHIAVCGFSNEILILDYNLTELKKISLGDSLPFGLDYSPNNSLLTVGIGGGNPLNIYIFDKKLQYKLISFFPKHTNLTKAIKFFDNNTIASAGSTNFEIYLWNIKRIVNGSDFEIYVKNIDKIIKRHIQGEGQSISSVGISQNKIGWGNKRKSKINENGIIEKEFNLKTMKVIKKNTHFKKLSIYKENLKLSHATHDQSFDPYKAEILILADVKKKKIMKIIARSNLDGYRHDCYGFYKNYIVSGGEGGSLSIYNLDGIKIASLKGHTGAIWGLGIYEDILISGSNDQTIKLWDLSTLESIQKTKINYDVFYKLLDDDTGENMLSLAQKLNSQGLQNLYILTPEIKPQLNLFISKNNEWIAWTNEGYFNASEKGMDYIYFHLNQGADKEAKAIPLERLYDHFFRPDLIQLKLKDEEAYQEKIKGLDFKIALRNPPPSIKFDTNISKTNDRNITLHYSIEESFTEDNRSGGIGLIRVYQEGKLIKTIGDGEVNASRAVADAMREMEHKKHNEDNINKEKKSKSSIREKISSNTKSVLKSMVQNQKEGNITIELIAGKNEITIEAFNKTNLVASKRDKIVIEANISKRTPNFYAIVAGVKEFEYENNLTYTEKDSDAINNFVDTKVRELLGKENVHIIYLKGKKVTKENLLNAIKKVDKVAKLEDTVLFFISTHGQTSPKEEYKDELFLIPSNDGNISNWIEFTKTFEKIQKIKTLNQIFVIDACYSGNADSHVSAIYDTKASVFAKKSGVHMLLATTKGALAMEKNKLGHGIFTDSILKALDSNETDENNDSIISVIELSKRLKKPLEKEHEQYPVIRNVGRDVRLERVE